MENSMRIRESYKLRLGTAEMDERIRTTAGALETARTAGEPTEDLEVKLDVARKEKELFLWQQDTTGALKGDRFGADLRAQFELLGGRELADGERSHVLLINMGELDRLNESGDHALGDKALELTFVRIQEQIRTHLKKT